MKRGLRRVRRGGCATIEQELERGRKFCYPPVKVGKGTRTGKDYDGASGNLENGTRKEGELQYSTWQFPQKGKKLL
jgi:hypothetical protein